MEQKWADEPWRSFDECLASDREAVAAGARPERLLPIEDEPEFVLLERANFERARACVNACAGIADPTGQFVNVIFDSPPGPQAGRFVEVETDDGRSIGAGEWKQRDNGYWALRIAVVAVDQATLRNAARYLWLRNPDRIPFGEAEGHIMCGDPGDDDVLFGEQLDRFIDRAMAP